MTSVKSTGHALREQGLPCGLCQRLLRPHQRQAAKSKRPIGDSVPSRISDWLEEQQQAAKEDRRPYPMSGPRAWKVDRCRKAYHAEKAYQAEEQGEHPPADNGNGQG